MAHISFSLKGAALDRLLAAKRVDEDVVVAEFKAARKQNVAHKKSKPVVA